MISNVLPLEWCASPQGCYKDSSGNPAVAPETTPNVVQDTLNDSVTTFLNISTGSIVKIVIALLIVLAIFIAIKVIKKAVVAGVSKAKEVSLSHLKDTAAYASAALSPEVLAADEKRREKYRQANVVENSTNGVAGFQDLMEDSRYTYLEELERQDKIQQDYDNSLTDDIPVYVSQKPYEDGSSEEDLHTKYGKDTNGFFTKKDPDKMFAKYNTELKDSSYETIVANANKSAQTLGSAKAKASGVNAKEALKHSLEAGLPYNHAIGNDIEAMKQAKADIDEKLEIIRKHGGRK